MSEVDSKALPGGWSLLKSAWGQFAARWSFFIRVQLLMFCVILFPIAVAALLALAFSWTPIFSIVLVLAMVLGGIGFLIAILWSQLALYASVLSAPTDTARAVFVRVKHKLIPFAWYGFVSSFVIVGGFLLFIIPGFIFAVWFSLSLWVLLVEDKRGLVSLLTSREYVRGKFWAVFWRLLLPTIVYFVIWAVIHSPSFVLGVVFHVPEISALSLVVQGVVTLLSVALGLIWAPVQILYSYLLYTEVKKVTSVEGFVPTSNQKGVYILLASLGTIIGIVLLCVAAWFIAAHVSARAQGWQTYNAALFSVSLPAKPSYGKEEGVSAEVDGFTFSEMLISEAATSTFVVQAAEFTSSTDTSDPSLLLEDSINGLQEPEEVAVNETSFFEFQGHSAAKIWYHYTDTGEDVITMFVFWEGDPYNTEDRYYGLSAVATTTEINADDFNRFADSFKVKVQE